MVVAVLAASCARYHHVHVSTARGRACMNECLAAYEDNQQRFDCTMTCDDAQSEDDRCPRDENLCLEVRETDRGRTALGVALAFAAFIGLIVLVASAYPPP